MRKIEIKTWKSPFPVRDKEGNVIEVKEVEENLLIALNVLIGNKDPSTMPRGLEKFRIFNKLSQAFDKADKTNVLELEEREYNFLKETIESDIPSSWGFNKNLYEAITSFLESKDE